MSNPSAPRRRLGAGRPHSAAPVPDLAEILQRGLEAFAELGYETASVRQLNTRLTMGPTFINDRFGSKEAFWKAVIAYGIGQVTGDVVAAVEAGDTGDDLERLATMVRAFHRSAARRPYLSRIMDYEAGRDTSRLRYLHEQMRPLNEATRPIFDRLVQQGTIRDIPWYLFHFIVTKPLSMYGQQPLARLFGRPADADDHQLLSTLVLEGLIKRDEPTK